MNGTNRERLHEGGRAGLMISEAGTTADARAEAEEDFCMRTPAYAATRMLDELRTREYGRLDATATTYLDYTGGGLYAESQLREHMELLATQVFGNPHSNNPTSLAMTHLVEGARHAVLRYFHADPAVYTVIFTPNCSGALRLVGEAYPFAAERAYALTWDNHNSVNGVREFAARRGAAVHYIPLHRDTMRLDRAQVLATLDTAPPGLFAFPAQSNFTGVQHPLDLVAEARARGWHVLLDCAAYVPTNELDLRMVQPDFIPLSFYKMFGYPTGVGALLARRDALARLVRPWFAGGTITIASVQGAGWHYLNDGEAGFEDGTVNYLSLPAIEIGLRHLQEVGVARIHARVMALTAWLLAATQATTHSNGAPLFRIFGPQDDVARGATIAFVLLDAQGRALDYQIVERVAGEAGISLRTGCFCNPGAGETAHQLEASEMAPFFGKERSLSFRGFYELAQAVGRSPSTLRVSLGIASNFADVWRFMQWARHLRDVDARVFNAQQVGASPGMAARDAA